MQINTNIQQQFYVNVDRLKAPTFQTDEPFDIAESSTTIWK